MSEVDKPFEIPSHWRWHRLDQVGEIHSGSTPSTKEDDNFGGDIPWLTPGDLSEYDGKFVSRGERNLTQKGLESCSAKLLPKGAVLFSSRAPIGYTVIAQNPISTNQGFKNLVPGDEVDNEFAYHYLKGSTGLAKSYASGTTFSELSATRFAQIPIPLPPLPEQRRIVAKIEELFSNLDAGRSDLATAEQQLERYRLSVLQAAVEGRLTADWRRTHDPEPADQLLEKNLKARENSSYHRKPSLEDFDDGYPSEIPDSWTWTRVGAVCYVRGGKAFRSKNYQDEGIPLVRISNIQDQKVTFEEDTAHLPPSFADEHGRYLMKQGDIVIAMSGATTGKLGVFEGEDDSALLNQRVGRFEFFDRGLISEDYFLHYLLTIQDAILREAYGAAQPNISATAISNFAFPLPPLAEQKQIVDEVERLLSVADDAAATADREQTRAERLRQSILKQAFSGRLVPHEEGAAPPQVDGAVSESPDSDPSEGADEDVEDLLGSADPDKQIEMDL